MGVLDDAIREHLELKRRHGASEVELARAEAEALGPARRDSAAAYDEPPAETGYAAAPTEAYGEELEPPEDATEPYDAAAFHSPEAPPAAGLFDHEAHAADTGAAGYAHAEEPAPEPYEHAEPPPAGEYEQSQEAPPTGGHEHTPEAPPAAAYDPAAEPPPPSAYDPAAEPPPDEEGTEPPPPAGGAPGHVPEPPPSTGGYDTLEHTQPTAPEEHDPAAGYDYAGYEHDDAGASSEGYGVESAASGDQHDYEVQPAEREDPGASDFAAPPDPTRPSPADELARPDPGEARRHGDPLGPTVPHEEHGEAPPVDFDVDAHPPQADETEPAAQGDPAWPARPYPEAVDQPTEHFVPPDVSDYEDAPGGEEQPRGGRLRRWLSRRSER